MESQNSNSTILLLHDGELSELTDLVESLGGSECLGEPSAAQRSVTWDLVLGTPKRIIDLHVLLPDTLAVRIAVMDGDSKTLRTMLRRAGTDLLVRRPVHPAALRLLILHSLYHGPERRNMKRVSIGAAVQVRSGIRRRPAILAELSTSGCRLLATSGCHPARTDRKLTLLIPPELSDGRPLSVSGEVKRVCPTETGADAIAMSFTKLRAKARGRIDAILAAHLEGPAMIDDGTAGAFNSIGTSGEEGTPREDEPVGETNVESVCDFEPAEDEAARPKRINPRHEIERRIIALGEEASRVLIGRDLSIGGMRIDSTPGLEVNDELQIALHVNNGSHPLVVSARIIRDDGDAGMALTFVDLSDPARLYLEDMLEALPAISEPEDADEDTRVIVSEMVSRRAS